jgi:hypothetical protein
LPLRHLWILKNSHLLKRIWRGKGNKHWSSFNFWTLLYLACRTVQELRTNTSRGLSQTLNSLPALQLMEKMSQLEEIFKFNSAEVILSYLILYLFLFIQIFIWLLWIQGFLIM